MAAQPQTQPRPLTREEIYGEVRAALVESLAIDDEEATPEARLTEELAAESIDNLDITFRLEKRFRLRIENDSLFPLTSFGMQSHDEYFMINKTIYTPEKIAGFKTTHPHLDLREFEAQPPTRNLMASVTVGSLVTYIERRLSEQNG
jgi:acyl carrier protein